MAGDKRSLSARYEYVDLGLSGFRKALEKARKALNDGPLVLSVVSYWEVVIKAQRGTLKIADPVNWWSRASDMLGAIFSRFEPLTSSVLAGLPDIHRDPFDRLLIAQAMAEALTLIASDEMFGHYHVRILW
jgi:PIN domain nuclease of toxin-antitoxin system